MAKYTCPKCGLSWDQQTREPVSVCLRCHEWVRPEDEKPAQKEKK